MKVYQINDESVTQPQKIAPTPCTRCFGVGTVHTYGTCYRCWGAKADPKIKTWAFPKSWGKEQCQAFLDKKQAEAERRLVKRLAADEAKNLEMYPPIIAEPVIEETVVESPNKKTLMEHWNS